jgi:hypothetical protein
MPDACSSACEWGSDSDSDSDGDSDDGSEGGHNTLKNAVTVPPPRLVVQGQNAQDTVTEKSGEAN